MSTDLEFQSGAPIFWSDIEARPVTQQPDDRPGRPYEILHIVHGWDDRTTMGHAIGALDGIDQFKRTGDPTVLMETTPEGYRKPRLIKLRGLLYPMVGVTPDTTIRNDYESGVIDAKDPSGTVVYKGLVNGVTPIVTIGEHVAKEGLDAWQDPILVRRLTIMEAEPASAPAVLEVANRYSYREYRAAMRLLEPLTTTSPQVRAAVQATANRWTAPGSDGLWELTTYKLWGNQPRSPLTPERAAAVVHRLGNLPMRRGEE